MIYYKVLKDGYDYFNKFAIVKNELLTPKERHNKARYISDEYFRMIQIPKTDVVFSFGCRFQKGHTTDVEADYIDVLSGKKIVEYKGNLYEVIDTKDFYVLLSDITDGYTKKVTYRDFTINESYMPCPR